MAVKKNKKKTAKETGKTSPPSSSSGKKGCLFFVFLFLVLFLLLPVGGGGLLFFAPSGLQEKLPFAATLREMGSSLSAISSPASITENTSSSRLPESMPADEILGRRLIEEAGENYHRKLYEKARNDARIALEKFPFSSPYWHRAADLITKSSFAILRTPGDIALEKKRILTGEKDTIRTLAARFDLTAESILAGNPALGKLSSPDLPIGKGRTLFLYCGKWNIKISNARKRLFVMDGKKLFAIYPVGIADDFGKAEMGSVSSITAKITRPAWKLDNDLYPPGHPMNILGGYSLEFRAPSTGGIFRIHGTNREENVGRTIKGPGCISMKNENIKELFHLIPTGTRVEVIR